MEKIREIIRLKEAGLSDRMIHRALLVSRPVVKVISDIYNSHLTTIRIPDLVG